ncbi:MAG: hypothetical protein ACLFVX_07925 [Archaeoglobaceae archaeon]
MNSSGVSETIGYIFVTAIVIVAISTVYVSTYDMLQDTSEDNKVEGLRQSFKRVQNVLSLSTYGGAPLQSIQVEAQGGMFTVQNETQVKVVANSSTVFDEYIGSFNYSYGDMEVCLEGGAIWEDYYGHKSAVSSPRIFIHTTSTQDPSQASKTVVIVVLNKLRGDFSVAGEGSLDLFFNKTTVNTTTFSEPGNVTLNVTSSYAELWNNFFEELPGDSYMDGDKVSFQSYYDKLIITEYEVRISAR